VKFYLKILVMLCAWSACVPAQTNVAQMLSGMNYQTGTSYTFVAQDSTRVTSFSNASAVALSLPSDMMPRFGAGSVFTAKNIGAGQVTVELHDSVAGIGRGDD
jgi:hypothetical protein